MKTNNTSFIASKNIPFLVVSHIIPLFLVQVLVPSAEKIQPKFISKIWRVLLQNQINENTCTLYGLFHNDAKLPFNLF